MINRMLFRTETVGRSSWLYFLALVIQNSVGDFWRWVFRLYFIDGLGKCVGWLRLIWSDLMVISQAEQSQRMINRTGYPHKIQIPIHYMRLNNHTTVFSTILHFY